MLKDSIEHHRNGRLSEAEEIARDWCARTGIAWLGRADIGHDAANKVVPFGLHRAG